MRVLNLVYEKYSVAALFKQFGEQRHFQCYCIAELHCIALHCIAVLHCCWCMIMIQGICEIMIEMVS